MLASSSLGFDLSVFELLVTLSSGGAVILTDNVLAMDQLTHRDKITLISTVPSLMKELLRATSLPRSVRVVNLIGERVERSLVEQIYAKSSVEVVYNLYGPTETTTYSTFASLSKGETNRPVIGKPVANTQIYILDLSLQVVPTGLPGEIWIGGAGVARGYINQPDLTKQRFLADPFRKGENNRMYRTGDLGRFLSDGTIELLGRVDSQIKIHGFRIEPSEVEAVLNRHPAVRESVVLARSLGADDRRLVAWFVPDQQPGPAHLELRSYLQKKLPPSMLPAAFVSVEAFPLTPNGKLDLQALPEVDLTRPEPRPELVAARRPIEMILVKIWSAILEIEEPSIHDNFFDLGGASFSALRVVNMAKSEGLDISAEMIFEHQTIATLADALERAPKIHVKNDPRRAFGIAEPCAASVTVGGAKTVRRENWPNTIVSSIGAYVPPKVVHSDDVVRGCARELKFPLEKMTGIRNRRMAREGEYAIDLAANAINECLANSPYTPADIDLLVCCNISRYDGPSAFSFEPATAIKLKSMLRFENAIGFDISNACAGVFTGIYVADSFLKSGAADRVMVVSGEYITHLTKTAQEEIQGFLDVRLACLTVGDSGIALILERGKDRSAGFHELEMFSCGEYWRLCVAGPTQEEHGGCIMLTESLKFAEIEVQPVARYALQVMGQAGWDYSTVDYLILHNTSRTTQSNSIREINKLFKRPVVHDGNYLHSLEERGNTASTSHWIAVADNIASGRI